MTDLQIILLVLFLVMIAAILVFCKIYAKPGTKLYENIQKLNALNSKIQSITHPTIF
jgi:cell division protein FtsL